MTNAVLILLAFLSGSLPFSYWIGRLGLGRDIRSVGDGNPGATNVLRAGGRTWGGVALLLDLLKGALPVGLIHLGLGIAGWPLALAAVAPILGHAFSPFLNFRGGKAVAVTAGVWAGLTAWEGPTIAGLTLLLAYAVVRVDGWAVMGAMIGMGLYFWFTPPTWNGLLARPDLVTVLLPVWICNVIILAWKHRQDLAQAPGLRAWIKS